MSMTPLPPVVIVDDGLSTLAPLTDLRSAFDVRTGAYTLLERVRRALGCEPAQVIVPEGLAAITRERHPDLPVNAFPVTDADALVLNARTGPVDRGAIVEACRERGSLRDSADEILCALAPKGTRLEPAVLGVLGAKTPIVGRADVRCVMTRPWHVRSLRDACIELDLALASLELRSPGRSRLERPDGVVVVGHHPLVIGAGTKLAPGVVLDVEAGPIVIDEGATVRPGAIVCGPAYVGPGSVVLDRALIKPNTAIGPSCKVAGEVGGTIFQGFANKAHDGHLGDSWIGEWVNLGAGTTNSNLLNTYSEVICRMLASPEHPAPSNERTGETFLGCILGDHVKTAICTRIMTGAVVGTGAMYAAGVPMSGTIAPMSWITDAGVKPFRFDKFMEVARAAMARRKHSPSPAYAARLRVIADSHR